MSPPPGAVLVLHSLPLEFPLAVAFAEQLLSWKSEDGEGRSEDEPDTVPASVLLQVVELLGEARALGELGPGGAAGGGGLEWEVHLGLHVCGLRGISITFRDGN